MLSLSAPGVCFRQKPDVDYALPPSREAISLLSSGVLWRDNTRLPEYDPVRVALELRAEEDGVEGDFVRRDFHDAERVEELPSGLAELLREHVVRGLVVEDAARHPLQGRAEVAQDPSPDARLLHPARLLEARLRRRRTRHRRFAGQLPQVHRKAVGKMRGGMRDEDC